MHAKHDSHRDGEFKHANDVNFFVLDVFSSVFGQHHLIGLKILKWQKISNVSVVDNNTFHISPFMSSTAKEKIGKKNKISSEIRRLWFHYLAFHCPLCLSIKLAKEASYVMLSFILLSLFSLVVQSVIHSFYLKCDRLECRIYFFVYFSHLIFEIC